MDLSPEKIFNNFADAFNEKQRIHDLCSKQIGNWILKKQWIQNNDSLLDFGCGVGSFSLTLFKQIGFQSCLGIDSADKMVAIFDDTIKAQNLGSMFDTKCIFLDGQNQLEDQFDVIISLKAFHHIPDPIDCVRVLKSYLKPNGRLIISDLMLNEHSVSYHRSVAEAPCCHGFTVEHMNDLLNQVGLQTDVTIVDVVHYMDCLDQEEGKQRYEDLGISECDILATEPSLLPSMYCIGNTYFERDVFPFVVACGRLCTVSLTNKRITTIH